MKILPEMHVKTRKIPLCFEIHLLHSPTFSYWLGYHSGLPRQTASRFATL